MIAPPWLKIPPNDYGGVEQVIESLCRELARLGVEVELFGVSGSKIKGVKLHAITKSEQFEYILKPMYDYSLPLQCAHVLAAIKEIQKDGNFDIIHDHNYFIGPSILSQNTGNNDIPPAIHTIHGPPITSELMLERGLPDNRPFWEAISGNPGCYFVPISNAFSNSIPTSIKPNLLDTVHNAIEMDRFKVPKQLNKKNYFITLARFCEEKGQATAVKLCSELGFRLRMAGTVATIGSSRKLILELANPLSKYRNNPDFRYYSDKVLPYTINNPKITYSGSVGGYKKMRLVTQAKALLFPINWEEPFGLAVIESLAWGTPVIAMNRGAMPEIIDHGINGFLANSEEEFAHYMQIIDEIDPEVCKQSVQKKFSSTLMAKRYIERYQTVIKARSR